MSDLLSEFSRESYQQVRPKRNNGMEECWNDRTLREPRDKPLVLKGCAEQGRGGRVTPLNYGVFMPVVTIELKNKKCRFLAMAPGAIGKVVASANDRSTLLKKARKAGVETPVIMPVLDPRTRYIF
jgi:hypothetical protein